MKLRRFLSPVLVSLLTVAATNALASNFVLTFNGLQNREEVLNYYDGGTGSLGSGPGTNYGITFTPSFICGCGYSFSRQLRCGNVERVVRNYECSGRIY